ncbi:hypothetical protein DdX_12083 [Ditylenchus destructor]|uniref:Uncharacterized protein n=1 Tax=Ditylenchus destructor TaxID=166010 RepID=A0AAD4N1H9_9BILA|nr:hypothetical protein DdX_12083 [Ditylenchus destructor]
MQSGGATCKAMQEAVKQYFEKMEDFYGYELSFTEKTEGTMLGTILTIYGQQQKIKKYFVKVHQGGPKKEAATSWEKPHLREVFLYKVLEKIGMISSVHFLVIPLKQEFLLCIATEEIDMTLLSKRLFGLTDIASNRDNFGLKDGSPVIFDFSFDTCNLVPIAHKGKDYILSECTVAEGGPLFRKNWKPDEKKQALREFSKWKLKQAVEESFTFATEYIKADNRVSAFRAKYFCQSDAAQIIKDLQDYKNTALDNIKFVESLL